MARFIGKVTGARGGSVTRLGHASIGLDVSANGWESGIRIHARVVDGRDVFAIYITAGSNKARNEEYLGCVMGEVFIPADKKIPAGY